MAKRVSRLDEFPICLAGFVLGVRAATVMTGLPAGPQPELQKIKWRDGTEAALTGFLAGGASPDHSKREMLR